MAVDLARRQGRQPPAGRLVAPLRPKRAATEGLYIRINDPLLAFRSLASEFERRMLGDLKVRQPDVLNSIRDSRELQPDTEKALTGFLDSFAKNFA